MAGVIYILTNPSFPDYVKIGYADDVNKRLKELNRSECTPFAFRLYAYYEVDHRLTDMKLHNIIDRLNPELRSIDNVDGKKRVREFYAISKEDAYEIFAAIAQINGLENKLHLVEQTEKEKEEEIIANDIANIKPSYTEEEHFIKKSEEVKQLYDSLKKEVLSKFDLEVQPKKVYISFKKDGKNIFDVKIMKYSLWIWINMPKGTLNDPKEFTRDVSNIGHNGNGDYDLSLSNVDGISYFIGLIEQSYKYNSK